jgi:hypothetical protein
MDDWAAKRLAELEAAAPKKRKRKTESFVKIARKQLAILRQGKASAAAWNVFVELAWLSWKSGGKPFKFGNYHLNELNISHDSRRRAIRELERLGLIQIETRPGKRTPIVSFPHRAATLNIRKSAYATYANLRPNIRKSAYAGSSLTYFLIFLSILNNKMCVYQEGGYAAVEGQQRRRGR